MDFLKAEEKTIKRKRLTMAELAEILEKVPRPQINVEVSRSSLKPSFTA